MDANVCKETTLKDVAKAAGVSMATVSRSLNDSTLIPEKTRKRVREIADEMEFEFNAHARSLITRRVGTIGIILPPEYDRFGVNLYHGTLHSSLRSVLECNDIDLIVAFLTNHFTGGNNIRKLVARKKVDGLIIVQPMIERELIDYLHSKDIPFVFSHYPPPDPCPPDIDIIYPDNEYGGYLAGRHFGDMGRQRVLCVTAPGDKEQQREYRLRLDGFRRALAEMSLALGPEDLLMGDMTMESGYDAVMGFRDSIRGYDALFATNDLMAIGALLAVRELGLRVPQDLSVIGYDDTDLAACIRPSLTTIHQPREELSLVTCERLIELVRGRHAGAARRDARRILLSPKLVVRETSMAGAPAARGGRP
ncbi:MAG TPA: LacI family DNA-binding transcriptional regulator [Spirochaetia bacterium]|nr:LacI family DNA-binding transcriptional regulator [Spirochaetia bacterium]